MKEKESEIESGWQRAEISAAIVHLYYMYGHSFDPAKLPRTLIANMLGVKRHTIWRAIKDAEMGLSLAEEMRVRLKDYFKDQEKLDEQRKQRKREYRAKRAERARERYKLAKEQERVAELRDQHQNEG